MHIAAGVIPKRPIRQLNRADGGKSGALPQVTLGSNDVWHMPSALAFDGGDRRVAACIDLQRSAGADLPLPIASDYVAASRRKTPGDA